MKRLLFSTVAFALNAVVSFAAIDFEKIASDVNMRRQLFPQAAAWKISPEEKISEEEQKCLDFLYSAMPLSDLLMYDGNYYLSNVRASLKTRKEMPWKNDISDDIFYHFVLPVRANNEYLDDFRINCYEELMNRVKGMSMSEAALEVNHWCHEKVTYEPSDPRTSSPLATMLTAKGRCGEESVFGVSALRAAGIPARQVYTPRWAHTDDNHAWVEVYADGKWHFLGACEPEPVLDMAWFNAPVSRGMLMHTRVFGDYSGTEQIINRYEGITEINVTDNYVPTHLNTVIVKDENGHPIEGVNVKFKIYNYAELYPAAQILTDSEGKASLLTGIGDIVAWAAKDDKFGFVKINGGEKDLLLNHVKGERISLDIDIVPPMEKPLPAIASPESVIINQRRFAQEDSIRNLYTSTFFTSDSIPNADNRLCSLLSSARGNWREIRDFLANVPDSRKWEALSMLEALNEKDLHDTPKDILLSALLNTVPDTANPHYIKYVLNPRIAYEQLSEYKNEKSGLYGENITGDVIADSVMKRIALANNYNQYRVPIIPSAVEANGIADTQSRNIYFVAECRKNGIPAKIDEITGKTMYFNGEDWVIVGFEKEIERPVVPTGTLISEYSALPYIPDPQYYRHFTLSAIEDGYPHLLEFDESDATWATILKNGEDLAEGYYLLTTGTRMASGNVLAHLEFFNVEENSSTNIPLILRQDNSAISVIGNLDAEKLYLPDGSDTMTSILSTTGRGYFLIASLGKNDEPTNHAVLELESITEDLNKWGRPILILTERKRDELNGIENLHYGKDVDNGIIDMIRKGISSDKQTLPLIAIADSFGRIVFVSEGYDTSLAQKIRQTLSGI